RSGTRFAILHRNGCSVRESPRQRDELPVKTDSKGDRTLKAVACEISSTCGVSATIGGQSSARRGEISRRAHGSDAPNRALNLRANACRSRIAFGQRHVCKTVKQALTPQFVVW